MSYIHFLLKIFFMIKWFHTFLVHVTKYTWMLTWKLYNNDSETHYDKLLEEEKTYKKMQISTIQTANKIKAANLKKHYHQNLALYDQAAIHHKFLWKTTNNFIKLSYFLFLLGSIDYLFQSKLYLENLRTAHH